MAWWSRSYILHHEFLCSCPEKSCILTLCVFHKQNYHTLKVELNVAKYRNCIMGHTTILVQTLCLNWAITVIAKWAKSAVNWVMKIAAIVVKLSVLYITSVALDELAEIAVWMSVAWIPRVPIPLFTSHQQKWSRELAHQSFVAR